MKKNNTEWSKIRWFFEVWWRVVVAFGISITTSVIFLGYVMNMSEYDGFGQFLSIFFGINFIYEIIGSATALTFFYFLLNPLD